MKAYIPKTAIESARCSSWGEAAHAAEFFDHFLYRNANVHPHEWIAYQPTPVRPGLPWVVFTIPEQFAPLAERMPLRECPVCRKWPCTCAKPKPGTGGKQLAIVGATVVCPKCRRVTCICPPAPNPAGGGSR